jgi:hypothetical protein
MSREKPKSERCPDASAIPIGKLDKANPAMIIR